VNRDPGRSFEDLLADPLEQFDPRSELLASIAGCRCGRHSERCASAITQEDLLCNPCRAGNCAARWRGTPLGWQYHTHIAWDGPRPGDDDPAGAERRMVERAEAMRRLHETYPEGSWINAGDRDDWDTGPLHLVDAAGRPYLNPAVPWTPHDHNGVPCRDGAS
jgi:hypothetical protein